MCKTVFFDRAPCPDLRFLPIITSLPTGDFVAHPDRFSGRDDGVRAVVAERCCRLCIGHIIAQLFVANAQKFLSFATTRGAMKPAALSFSVRPSFRCPE